MTSQATRKPPRAEPQDFNPGLMDTSSHSVPTPSRPRILVVDDSVDTAQSFCWLLEASGFDARPAFDGPTALREAASFRPDFVLLDIGLPHLDGFEVASRLRADDSTRAATLIAVSGYSRDDDRRRSQAVGFDHHLVKPVEFDDLLALILRDRPA